MCEEMWTVYGSVPRQVWSFCQHVGVAGLVQSASTLQAQSGWLPGGRTTPASLVPPSDGCTQTGAHGDETQSAFVWQVGCGLHASGSAVGAARMTRTSEDSSARRAGVLPISARVRSCGSGTRQARSVGSHSSRIHVGELSSVKPKKSSAVPPY